MVDAAELEVMDRLDDEVALVELVAEDTGFEVAGQESLERPGLLFGVHQANTWNPAAR